MKGKTYISDALKSKNTGKPIFALSQPIMVDGRPAGVFFSVVDISDFTKEHIASVRIGETGYAYLYGGEGVIISHPESELILNKNMKDFAQGAQMMTMGSGKLKYTDQGRELLVNFKKIPEAGWTLAMVIDTDEMFAAARTIGYYNIVLTFLVVVCISLGVASCLRWLVIGPIKKAVHLADAIALGDLSQRLSVNRRDEMGALAKSWTAWRIIWKTKPFWPRP